MRTDGRMDYIYIYIYIYTYTRTPEAGIRIDRILIARVTSLHVNRCTKAPLAENRSA